ncbi:PaaI family thioesterase [Neobacillus mesonae]|nr:PaaI family thioesterase [Neobacillus mesonae]
MDITEREHGEAHGQDDDKRAAYIAAITKAAEPTFWGYLGCKLEKAGSEEVIVSLDPLPHHLNLIGIVHGGVLSSLMDNTMGVAVMLKYPDRSSVTSNLNVHFVMPAKQERLIVMGRIVHETGRSITAESRISDSRGELVALSTASFRLK